MARGGKRAGAGRPKGAASKRTREIANAIAAGPGLTPLEFLTAVYQDEQEDKARRIDAAKAAAPYVHPKLSQIDAKFSGGGDPIETVTRIELIAVEPDGNGSD